MSDAPPGGITRRDAPSGPSRASAATDPDEDFKRLGLRQHRRPRLHEFDYVGAYAYHLVVVTIGRQPDLDGQIAASLIERLRESAESEAFELLAYAVMPDHAHILALGLNDAASAIRFMKLFKQTTSFDFIQRTGGRLWQQSFYDHVLRRNEDPLAIARYTVENPVRAGFVQRYEDWPLSGGTLVATDAPGRT